MSESELARIAALRTAWEIVSGNLDGYPLDYRAAEDRLDRHLGAGDIRPDEVIAFLE